MALNIADLSRLSRLLDEALALDVGDRNAWIHALPPSDQVHVQRLRAMLDLHSDADVEKRLDSLPRLGAREDVGRPNDRVGPYRLLREVGCGGMGSVWLAERADGQFTRQVALKLPRLVWGGGLAERMGREREIGMLLEHPAIARLYDAGLDERGRPYLALEYIDGQPLDAWCKAQSLDIPARLRLFLQVVRAVAYAHARLVVHRDLKPSNVLVSADGQAHLLDFGIAKLLTESASAEPGVTLQQGRVMTPHYASPEQLRGGTVTVASDVYSLGVLLFELLTGALPFERHDQAGAHGEGAPDREVPLASTRAADPHARRALRGELDAIVAKAMQHDPQRRYATADALADDLERHLRGDVVLAQPDNLGYRFLKTLRRHRVGFASGAAVAISLLIGAGVAIAQAQRAQAEAQRATAAADRARAVKDFVVDVFKVNTRDSATNNEARQLPAELLLDRGARLIDVKFAGQRDLQSELYGVVTQIMLDMKADQLGLQYATKHVEALKAAGAASERLSEGSLLLAEALKVNRRESDAEKEVRNVLRTGTGVDLAVRARLLLVDLLLKRNDFHAALLELDQIDKDIAANASLPAPLIARSTYARARTLAASNKFDQARPLFERAIATAFAAEGPFSRLASNIRISYAHRLVAAGFPEVAKATYRQAIEAMRAIGGADDLEAALAETDSMGGLVHSNAMSHDEVMAVLARTIGILDHQGSRVPAWVRADVEHSQSCMLVYFGHFEEAYVLASKSVPVLRATTHDQSAGSCLAWAQMETGRHAQAEAEFDQQVTMLATGNGCTSWCLAHAYVAMAENRVMQGHYSHARELLDSVPDFVRLNGATSSEASAPELNVRVERARIELEEGNFAKAVKLLDGVPDGLYMFNRTAFMRAEARCRLEGSSHSVLESMKRELRAFHAASGYKFDPEVADARARVGLCELMSGDHKSAHELERLAREAFAGAPRVSPYYKRALLELQRRLG